jgi:glycosyltransferase involved in cell wall biosynthesis
MFKSLAAESPALTAPRRLRLTLCLLTWNEIDGCKNDVPKLPLGEFEEVYAVDAGSSDGTVEYLRSQGIVVHQQPVRGYNQAYHCAFDKCTTDALILFHPKGGIDPSSVARFRPLLEEGHDLVIASRMSRGARNEEDDKWLRPRKWFVEGLGLLTWLIWSRNGPIIWDVLHGMRAMRRARFLDIDPLPSGLSIDLEMVVRSYRLSFSVVEFPIAETARIEGNTHFSAWPTGKLLLGYLLWEFGRVPSPVRQPEYCPLDRNSDYEKPEVHHVDR